ncbi:DUF1508 domain-containing protein [Pseudonocardia sichuanensis]
MAGAAAPCGIPPTSQRATARQLGEAYETKAAAKKGCESLLKAADGAPVVETDS